MSALGSLAAAAAHELGGPLGTITLVARDLDASLAGDPDFGDDIRLLNQEVTRARDILASLAGRAEAEEPFPRLGLPALLHEVAEPFVNARVPVRVKEGAAVPVIRRSPELLHGLSNLIDNAVRHAATCVTLDGLADGSEIMVVVRDDGDGFDPDLLPVLGEPFLGPSRSRDGGTGLGVFISTTLLERTGARVVFGNAPEGGARVEIRWPRHHIEAND
jgi:two-component system sensor histidine kinase RegB